MKTASIEQVVDVVFAAIVEEGGVAVGNAGVVDIGGETLVFDTHLSLTAARAFRRPAEALRQAASGDPNPFPHLPSAEMWERNLLNA